MPCAAWRGEARQGGKWPRRNITYIILHLRCPYVGVYAMIGPDMGVSTGGSCAIPGRRRAIVGLLWRMASACGAGVRAVSVCAPRVPRWLSRFWLLVGVPYA